MPYIIVVNRTWSRNLMFLFRNGLQSTHGEFFLALQIILISIVGQLLEGASVGVAVGVSDILQVT